MHIAVVGAGGVGGYFGGRLLEVGQQVTFIARGAHAQAIRQVGLRVESAEGSFQLPPGNVEEDPARVGEVDVVILAVKSWQVAEAAQMIRPLIGAQTFILPLQNGIDSPGELAALYGRPAVLPGFARLLSHIAAPGIVRHDGRSPLITFGEMDNRPSERASALGAALSRAKGVSVEIAANIEHAIWTKFVLIASLGALGAVTGASYGEIRAEPRWRQMLAEAVREAARVGSARGIQLTEDDVRAALELFESLPAAGKTSMQRDIAAGRPSELQSLSGAVVRLGAELGVPTPVHEGLYAQLWPRELTARASAPRTA